MEKNTWENKIREACVAAGTYKDYFEIVIRELAEILERRDAAVELYDRDPQPVVTITNVRGAENVTKNPLLMLIDDMNKTSLAYWKELGLTPAGLKRINDKTFREKEKGGGNSLIDRLKELQAARGSENGV